MTSESEGIKNALEDNDATATCPVADALADEGHPHAEELCKLAQDIVSSDDWSVALMSAMVFLTLLERKH